MRGHSQKVINVLYKLLCSWVIPPAHEEYHDSIQTLWGAFKKFLESASQPCAEWDKTQLIMYLSVDARNLYLVTARKHIQWIPFPPSGYLEICGVLWFFLFIFMEILLTWGIYGSSHDQISKTSKRTLLILKTCLQEDSLWSSNVKQVFFFPANLLAFLSAEEKPLVKNSFSFLPSSCFFCLM